jgi:polar amino acid transport system substrate-binding protein
MAKLSDELKNISTKKTVSVISTLLVMGLILFFLLRSCMGNGVLTNQTYLVARDPSWYPMDLLGKEKNMLGFTNELFLDIGKRQGIRFELDLAGSEGLIQGLNSKKYDGVMSALTPTPVNENRYDFSKPFYLLGPVLIIPIKSTVKSFDDLEGRTVAIKRGSPLAFKAKSFPKILFTSYGNMRRALDDLEENRIDAVIMDAMIAYSYAHGEYEKTLKVVGAPLTTEGLRLVTRQDPRSVALISKFNVGLEEMIEDGSLQKLLSRWSLFDTSAQTKKKEMELIEKKEEKNDQAA